MIVKELPAGWAPALFNRPAGFRLIGHIASQTRYQRRAGLNIAVLVFQPDRL